MEMRPRRPCLARQIDPDYSGSRTLRSAFQYPVQALARQDEVRLSPRRFEVPACSLQWKTPRITTVPSGPSTSMSAEPRLQPDFHGFPPVDFHPLQSRLHTPHHRSLPGREISRQEWPQLRLARQQQGPPNERRWLLCRTKWRRRRWCRHWHSPHKRTRNWTRSE